MSSFITLCMINIEEFINEYNYGKNSYDKEYIDDTHGKNHAEMVMNNCMEAINSRIREGYYISIKDKTKIMIAGALHDMDDRKYFPLSTNFDNARLIINRTNENRRLDYSDKMSDEDIEDIIKMISWVSSSKNGDTIPDEAIRHPELLYPRYADRLEAIGLIGLYRTLHYTLKVGDHLFNSETLKAHTEEELFNQVATRERYDNYIGKIKSDTMIDHFYDKLLRACDFPIDNEFFRIECAKRKQPLIDVALYFGNNDITEKELKNYIEELISL